MAASAAWLSLQGLLRDEMLGAVSLLQATSRDSCVGFGDEPDDPPYGSKDMAQTPRPPSFLDVSPRHAWISPRRPSARPDVAPHSGFGRRSSHTPDRTPWATLRSAPPAGTGSVSGGLPTLTTSAA
jgi:hypothetical protein